MRFRRILKITATVFVLTILGAFLSVQKAHAVTPGSLAVLVFMVVFLAAVWRDTRR